MLDVIGGALLGRVQVQKLVELSTCLVLIVGMHVT